MPLPVSTWKKGVDYAPDVFMGHWDLSVLHWPKLHYSSVVDLLLIVCATATVTSIPSRRNRLTLQFSKKTLILNEIMIIVTLVCEMFETRRIVVGVV